MKSCKMEDFQVCHFEKAKICIPWLRILGNVLKVRDKLSESWQFKKIRHWIDRKDQ